MLEKCLEDESSTRYALSQTLHVDRILSKPYTLSVQVARLIELREVCLCHSWKGYGALIRLHNVDGGVQRAIHQILAQAVYIIKNQMKPGNDHHGPAAYAHVASAKMCLEKKPQCVSLRNVYAFSFIDAADLRLLPKVFNNRHVI